MGSFRANYKFGDDNLKIEKLGEERGKSTFCKQIEFEDVKSVNDSA